MPTYIVSDGMADTRITAGTPREACEQFVSGGEWDAERKTTWVRCTAMELTTGFDDPEVETHTIEIEPDEPECTEDEHDWCSPVSVVGGIESNPGVQGHGGGVIITTVCRNCGRYKIKDTWAQHHGREGLESIEYRNPDRKSEAWLKSLAVNLENIKWTVTPSLDGPAIIVGTLDVLRYEYACTYNLTEDGVEISDSDTEALPGDHLWPEPPDNVVSEARQYTKNYLDE